MTLRVCIDARLVSGLHGGIEQMVIGLGAGLSRISTATEEYRFLCYDDSSQYLAPYLSGQCSILSAGPTPPPSSLSRLGSAHPLVRKVIDRSPLPLNRSTIVPRSDGRIEAAIDVVHFPKQTAFLTEVPFIYQPHDLLHLHYPQYFGRRARNQRDLSYRTFCEAADAVVMMTEWGKQDLIARYRLTPEKVHVVPGAPMLEVYESSEDEMLDLKERFRLPDAFLLYPAQTWPHKNHLRLIQAIADLRDRGINVPLVFSGRTNYFSARLRKEVERLSLGDQVMWVGFVTATEIRSLYELSMGVVFPSKFEGFGFPILEAMWAGKPVACSDVGPIAEVAGEAALYFDADDVSSIADAVRDLYTDPSLRASLISKGNDRVGRYSWERTASMFRDLYRQVSGLSR